MKIKIGIIGLGIVGKTLFDWVKKKKFEAYGYDKIIFMIMKYLH
ncbi:MAG: hypothetical protein QXT38_03595 [Candidatus Aenigmatarchaeota archaeon]